VEGLTGDIPKYVPLPTRISLIPCANLPGVAVTNFLNLFLTLRPNSTNYGSNLTTVVEIQANYHCKMVKHSKKMCQHSTYVLYPDDRVQKQYNEWLRETGAHRHSWRSSALPTTRFDSQA
jgi:hypothetical protein